MAWHGAQVEVRKQSVEFLSFTFVRHVGTELRWPLLHSKCLSEQFHWNYTLHRGHMCGDQRTTFQSPFSPSMVRSGDWIQVQSQSVNVLTYWGVLLAHWILYSKVGWRDGSAYKNNQWLLFLRIQSNCNSHLMVHNYLYSSFRRSDPLFWPLWTSGMQAEQNIHALTHKIKISKKSVSHWKVGLVKAREVRCMLEGDLLTLIPPYSVGATKWEASLVMCFGFGVHSLVIMPKGMGPSATNWNLWEHEPKSEPFLIISQILLERYHKINTFKIWLMKFISYLLYF